MLGYHENPLVVLQLMEDLTKAGFRPAFTFSEGMLELVIRKNTPAKIY
jgi:hypothetical protein